MRKMALFKRATLGILVFIFACAYVLSSVHTSTTETPFDYRLISQQIEAINFTKIPEHIQALSDLGCRITGYNSSDAAADYIYNAFIDANLSDVHFEYYNVTVPVDYGASIDIVRPTPSPIGTIQAYPLMPNLVNPCSTPEGGVVGQLIYVGQGDLTDFNGKDVEGSIVLMDFNSGDNWINAAMLGAEAIIFIEPNETSRFEANSKTVETPLNVPRLYISQSDANSLLNLLSEGEVIVKVASSMNFEVKKAKNVVGLIPGSEYPEEILVISSYYDSASIVPSLSPGADEACGVATLLELASFFGNNPPKRTLMFVAFSGHNQRAAGAREFVYQRRNEINSKIKMVLNIDLSTTSDTLVVNFYGWLYKFNFIEFNADLSGAHFWIGKLFTETVLSELQKETGKSYNVDLGYIKDWVEKAPIYYVLDHEPYTAAGGPGVSFFTGKTFRLRWNTPFDVYEHININNLRNQVEYVFSCAYTIANLGADEFTLPSLPTPRFSLSYDSFVGYSSLVGRVVEYDPQTDWFKIVPNALISIRPFGRLGVIRDVLMSIITRADDKGEFKIHGVSPSQPDRTLSYIIEAYVVNSTGHLIYAPNLGAHGATYPRLYDVNKDPVYATTVVFQCGSISLYGVTNPHNLQPAGEQTSFTVRDIETHTEVYSYGYRGSGTVAMVFTPTDKKIEIVGNTAGVSGSTLIATNSSDQHPGGYGYNVKTGEVTTLGYAYASTIKDWISLIKMRRDAYEAYNIKNYEVTAAFEEAQTLFSKAQEYYNEEKYDAWIAEIRSAYVFFLDAYNGARSVLTDVSLSVIFFCVLLIPFVIVLERLFFAFKGTRRMIAITILYIIFVTIFHFIHPGLNLASNLSIVIIGITALMLAFPPLLMIYNEGYSFLKEMRRKLIGVHFAEIGRFSAILLAFSSGIASMRRRKVRTLLTVVTMVLVIYSLTLFTSTSLYTVVRAKELSGETLYNGILLRSKDWSTPLSEDLYHTIRAQYREATITARAWLYPPASVTSGYLHLRSSTSSTEVMSLLGLSPEETSVTKVNSTLLPGGRWFTHEDLFSCVLADKLADQLNITKPGELVFWGHIPFEVVGIFNSSKFASIRDLDQEHITPRELIAPDPSIHMKAEHVFIVPYRTAYLLGASTYTISLHLRELDRIEHMASELAKSYARDLDIYAGINGKIQFHRRGAEAVLGGWSIIAIPAIIAVLIMMNAAIGVVHGRRTEIGTLTSVGLAPVHIVGMFLAEFFVYAMLGALIGYLSGIATTSVLAYLNLLPEGLTVNASSSSVLYVLSFAILSILLAVAYPLREAARISVPSIERAWKMPTKPVGDEWRVPLPFTASTNEEAEGMLVYLHEYFEIFRSESAGGVFAARELRLEEKEHEGKRVKALSTLLHLEPFDLGIVQDSVIHAVPSKGERYEFEVFIRRHEGPLSAWKTSNRNFVDTLRKQLLIWRGLSPTQKSAYIKRYGSLVKK